MPLSYGRKVAVLHLQNYLLRVPANVAIVVHLVCLTSRSSKNDFILATSLVAGEGRDRVSMIQPQRAVLTPHNVMKTGQGISICIQARPFHMFQSSTLCIVHSVKCLIFSAPLSISMQIPD